MCNIGTTIHGLMPAGARFAQCRCGDLEYQPLSDKIRAGIFGRGVWESSCSMRAIFFHRSRRLHRSHLPVHTDHGPTQKPKPTPSGPLQMEGATQCQLCQWNIGHLSKPTNPALTKCLVRCKAGREQCKRNRLHHHELGCLSEAEGCPFPIWRASMAPTALGTGPLTTRTRSLGWAGNRYRFLVLGTPNKAARMDLYQYAVSGLTRRRDHLISPAIDFFTHQNISPSFDHAYARRNGNLYDTLIVSVSTDCGQSWSEVSRRVHGQGAGLATRGNVSVPVIRLRLLIGAGSASGCSVVI